MTKQTRLERRLDKEIDRATIVEQSSLYHHIKDLEKAEKHRKEIEHLRKELAKLQLREARLEEKIREHEILVQRFESGGPMIR